MLARFPGPHGPCGSIMAVGTGLPVPGPDSPPRSSGIHSTDSPTNRTVHQRPARIRYLTNHSAERSGVAAGDVTVIRGAMCISAGSIRRTVLSKLVAGIRTSRKCRVACVNSTHGAAFADLTATAISTWWSTTTPEAHVFNDGKGRFTPSPQLLNAGRGGTLAALADADGDGDSTLYRQLPPTRWTPRLASACGWLTTGPSRRHRWPALTTPEWTNRFRFKVEWVQVDECPLSRGTWRGRSVLPERRQRHEPVSWTSGAFLDEDGKPLGNLPSTGDSPRRSAISTATAAPPLRCNDFGTRIASGSTMARGGSVRLRASLSVKPAWPRCRSTSPI